MQFHVIRLPEMKPVPIDGEPRIFNDGEEAAKHAKALHKQYGFVYKPKPILTTEWQKREQQRMTDGTYRFFDFMRDKWYIPIPLHFAHMTSGFKLSYTEDTIKGNRDIKTVTTVGRYLTEFYSHLGAEKIKAIASVSDMEGYNFGITTSEKDIWRIFSEGPHSCMKPGSKDLDYLTRSLGYKPTCLAYANCDFAIAYLEYINQEKNVSVVARAVCVPEKKLYVKIYGDTWRLQKFLAAEGYRQTTSYSDYKGLKLSYVGADRIGSTQRPYLDFGHDGVFMSEDKKHLIIR